MGHAIPKQHPAVVLRSHFNLVRALLAAAIVALVGMAIALVIVASDGDQIDTAATQQTAPVMSRLAPVPAPAPVPADPTAPGLRYDGGPEEGSRGAIAVQPVASADPSAPGLRYDGGPEEGSRGVLETPATPESRYDGGPNEGTRGPGFSTD